MKAAAGLIYPALSSAVLPAFLVAVSCGGEGDESVTPGTASASPTVAPPPVATVMPISESIALWEWIVVNSPECEPILRPTYLPSALTEVSLDHADERLGCVLFGVSYSDSISGVTLLIGGGPWFNPQLPGPDTVQEEVEVRGARGLYQLQDTAEPSGQAFLTWNEPGKWGRTGDDWHRDYVEYLISSEGFPKDELLKVANSLEPVER